MDLVDVVNLKATTCGRKFHGVAEFANLLDTIVRGTIDFEDVERPTFGDFDAHGIVGIEVNHRSPGTVEGFGQDSCGGRLTGASWSYKEVGVGKAFLFDSISKSANDMILSQDISEGAGAILACKDLVTHVGKCREDCEFVMTDFSK